MVLDGLALMRVQHLACGIAVQALGTTTVAARCGWNGMGFFDKILGHGFCNGCLHWDGS
jgi:hypothetical protein